MKSPKPQKIWTPVLVLAAVLAGGFAVYFLWIRLARQQTLPAHTESEHAPLPSAHMGAREEQIDHTMQHPPASELDAGGSGTTGAAYDLDPDSVTPG